MSRLARKDLPRVSKQVDKPINNDVAQAPPEKPIQKPPATPKITSKLALQHNSKPLLNLITTEKNTTSSNFFTRIDSFTGPFDWLSLEYPSQVFYQNAMYPSILHALSIAQYQDVEQDQIEHMKTEKEIYSFVQGKNVKENWIKDRLKIMEQLQREKYRRNEELQQKLKNTGSREIVWVNKVDAYFGEVSMKGQNHIGRILNEIRKNIKEGTELDAWLVLCHEISTDKSIRPIVKLTEKKNGSLEPKIIELANKGYYTIGKLPDNDIVTLNPSISRRHALITSQKDGQVLLFDLKSKAKTYLNGSPLPLDHVGYPICSGDSINFGTSTRTYFVQIDHSNAVDYLEKKSKEISYDIAKLSGTLQTSLLLDGQRKIFIAGLSFKTSEDDLRDYFSHLGVITSLSLPQSHHDKEKLAESSSNQELFASRGIAFIEFSSPESALAALEKNGRSLNGRVIKVKPADPKSYHGKHTYDSSKKRPFYRDQKDGREFLQDNNFEGVQRQDSMEKAKNHEKFHTTSYAHQTDRHHKSKRKIYERHRSQSSSSAKRRRSH